MRRIVVYNGKGGCGKTTTAVNLAAALAERGRDVLLLDLDPQANACSHLGLDPRARGLADAIEGADVADLIQTRDVQPGLSLLPPGARLAALLEAGARPADFARVLDVLPAVPRWIVADCAPALSSLTLPALAWADGLLVPVEVCGAFAVEAVARVLAVLEAVRREAGRAPEVLGYVPCRMTMTRVSLDTLAVLGANGARVFRPIPASTRVPEAAAWGVPVLEHAPDSAPATAYRALAEALHLAAAKADCKAVLAAWKAREALIGRDRLRAEQTARLAAALDPEPKRRDKR